MAGKKSYLQVAGIASLFEHQNSGVRDIRKHLPDELPQEEPSLDELPLDPENFDLVMENLLAELPENQRAAFLDIFTMLLSFCKEYLDAEYVTPMITILGDVLGEGLPIESGKPGMWAAGMAYAVAKINFVTEQDHPLRITPRELAPIFNVSYSGMQAKCSLIIKELGIIDADPGYTVFSGLYDNPNVWRIFLEDGRVVDTRALPRDQQLWLCERSYIPFVYADGNPYTIDED